ncbi:hypothetical protein Y032_0143g2354 [Ancylostoma ceylanicum]|nr:hypothetical protein Y032_0143g2354 [Ancylostoma ceylanicum]
MRNLQELRRQEVERRTRGRLPSKSHDQSVEYVGQKCDRAQQRGMRSLSTFREAQAVASPHFGNQTYFAENPRFAPVEVKKEESYSRNEFLEGDGVEESYPREGFMEDEEEEESHPRMEFMEDEEEQELYLRNEFIFEESRAQNYRQEMPSSLFDCISNGFLDMARAARLTLYQLQQGVFNQAAYDVAGFVNSEDAIGATPRFCELNDLNDPEALWLNTLANRLMGEITRAHILKTSRPSSFIKAQALSSTMLNYNIAKCSKKWTLQASPPFVELNIRRVAERWMPRKNDTALQQLTSLYRYILLRVTDPPHKIKEFSVRMNKGGGRDEKLKDLPKMIEATLTGFGEDIIGRGDDKPNSDAVASRNQSSEEKRNESPGGASCERDELQSNVLKSLQRALRDVRSYGFDEAKGRWLPSNRKSKRAIPERNVGAATNETADMEDQSSSRSASN